MFIPQTANLTAIIGGTFDPVFTFYTDAAQTEPLDLSNFSAHMNIGAGKLVLVSGTSALTLGGTDGTIAVLLTDAQTSNFSNRQVTVHWFLKLIDNTAASGSGVGFPLNGNILFEMP